MLIQQPGLIQSCVDTSFALCQGKPLNLESIPDDLQLIIESPGQGREMSTSALMRGFSQRTIRVRRVFSIKRDSEFGLDTGTCERQAVVLTLLLVTREETSRGGEEGSEALRGVVLAIS